VMKAPTKIGTMVREPSRWSFMARASSVGKREAVSGSEMMAMERSEMMGM